MTKIDLVTGILGSGKTTFLRGYVRHLLSKGMRVAVLENDLGAVNIDMMMLSDLQSENCTVTMIVGGGDPCCHRRRFKTQLINLGMEHYDRVIVEPSGIFDMDEFFDILHESPIDRWFEVGSVLTILDGTTEDVLSEEMEYILASEAACCGRLLLSKGGATEKERSASAERILSHLDRALEFIRCDRRFSLSDIVTKPWEEFSPEDYDSLMTAGYRGSAYVKRYSTETFRSGVHYFMHVRFPLDKTEELVRSIFSDKACGGVYRVKGAFVDSDGSWHRLNATAERTEISPSAKGQAGLIVIGDGLDRKAIDGYISAINEDPEYVSI